MEVRNFKLCNHSPRENVYGKRDVGAMCTGSNDCSKHYRSEPRARRWSKMATCVLATTLAASLCLMPVGAAFADQVLELPPTAQSPAPSRAFVNSSATESTPRHAHRQAIEPLPEGLGTLQDYERETASDTSAAPAAGYATAPANQRFEGNRNRDVVAQNAMLGVLMIGLFAMELSTAHHHRHH